MCVGGTWACGVWGSGAEAEQQVWVQVRVQVSVPQVPWVPLPRCEWQVRQESGGRAAVPVM